MPHSRLTKKRQATIPKAVCAFLDLDAGDSVAFAIVDGKVFLQKSTPLDPEYLRSVQGTLSSEWLSKEDALAYDDL